MDWRTFYNATKAMIDEYQDRVKFLQAHPILAWLTIVEQGILIKKTSHLIKNMEIAIYQMENEKR